MLIMRSIYERQFCCAIRLSDFADVIAGPAEALKWLPGPQLQWLPGHVVHVLATAKNIIMSLWHAGHTDDQRLQWECGLRTWVLVYRPTTCEGTWTTSDPAAP